MKIVTKEPALILTDAEYQTLNDARAIIREINEKLSNTDWEAVQHRFNGWFGDTIKEIDAIMRWADESE